MFVSEKLPLAPMLEMSSLASPVLVKVTVLGLLAVFINWAPKLRLDGESVIGLMLNLLTKASSDHSPGRDVSNWWDFCFALQNRESGSDPPW